MGANGGDASTAAASASSAVDIRMLEAALQQRQQVLERERQQLLALDREQREKLQAQVCTCVKMWGCVTVWVGEGDAALSPPVQCYRRGINSICVIL